MSSTTRTMRLIDPLLVNFNLIHSFFFHLLSNSFISSLSQSRYLDLLLARFNETLEHFISSMWLV
jgi:hypothetical protein